MSNVLGIDLGASYAKAVYVREEDGKLVPLLNTDQSCVFRVCAARSKSGELALATTEQERMVALDSGVELVENVKALRGGDDPVAKELEVAVLKMLRSVYQESSGDRNLRSLRKVVLAHPVSTGPAALQALRNMAIEAGFPVAVLDTIEEPVAGGLFAARADNFNGKLLVVDAGHYTTDFVLFEAKNNQTHIESSKYLNLRLGVGEFSHAIARSIWLKAQAAADEAPITDSPFDVSGPEHANILVSHLSAEVEEKVIHARSEFFDRDNPAIFYPGEWERLTDRKWVGKLRKTTIEYHYDVESSRQEDLSNWLSGSKKNLERVFQLNFRSAIRPLLHSIQAATFGVLHDLDGLDGIQIVLGGGLSLLPEVRDAINQLAALHGLQPPSDITYDYEVVGTLPMANLLWVASGAALAGQNGLTRQDTLSDTVGILVAYDLEEGLKLLDRYGVLPPTNSELRGVIKLPNGEHKILLHRVLAHRGVQLPCTLPFPDFLEPLRPGAATIPLTRFGEDGPTLEAVPAADAPGIAAYVDVPSVSDEKQYRLVLDIRRNDDWDIRVEDLNRRTVKTVHAAILFPT